MKKTIAFLICLAVCAFFAVFPHEEALTASNATMSVDLPIVMYHSVLKSHQSKYAVSPEQLRSDFEAFGRLGYTPVTLREVVAFVDGHGSLPSRPMVITFDDGHYNNMHYVLPIAKEFDFKIVISPVTSFGVFSQQQNDHSNPNYSYLTPGQLGQLEASGLVEIGNHTHAMHSFKPRYGIKQRAGESDEAYLSALTYDIQTAQTLMVSNGVSAPVTFAYPFGAYNTAARNALLRMGFRALLTCNEGVSKITQGDPTSLHSLKRYNRSGRISTEAFVKKVFEPLDRDNAVK